MNLIFEKNYFKSTCAKDFGFDPGTCPDFDLGGGFVFLLAKENMTADLVV